MFGLKNTKVMIAGSVGLFAATAAYAVSLTGTHLDNYSHTDIRNGGSIRQSQFDVRNMRFNIDDSVASRAELRRESQNSGAQTMGGNFYILEESSGANRASIIQVLTVEAANRDSGTSNPDEQLAIRKTNSTSDGKPEWEFYLVHTPDQPRCTTFKFVRGQKFSIKMEYEKDQNPRFIIKKGSDQRSCTSGSPFTVGENRAGSRGRYYYGKLGVYATSSGQGPLSVRWDRIYD